MQSGAKQLEEAKALTNEAYATMKEQCNTKNEIEYINTIDRTLSQYREIYGQVVEIALAGHDDEAYDMMLYNFLIESMEDELDYFAKRNTHEIFRMAILEAIYYDNTVIVLKASGSALITENNVSVYICNSEEEVVQKVMTVKARQIGKAARKVLRTIFCGIRRQKSY